MPRPGFCDWNTPLMERYAFLLFLLQSLVLVLCESQCQEYSESQTINVDRKYGHIVELHLRQNIKGDVEIRDGVPSSSNIVIEIDKTASEELHLDNILTNSTLFDVGYGKIFVLQLDYREESVSLVTIIISAIVAGIIFAGLLSVIAWWYCKQEQNNQRFVAVTHPEVHDIRRSSLTQDAYEPEETDDRLNPDGTALRPPPPPRRLNGGNFTNNQTDSPANQIGNHTSAGGGGSPHQSGGGGGGTLSRPSVIALGLVCVISVVYASCSLEPRVHVIVFIPPMIQLHKLQLYFKRSYENDVIKTGWTQGNRTTIEIFDLLDVGPTNQAPCSAKTRCPDAYQDGLAGCDPRGGHCICQRGYQLVAGKCQDINECSSRAKNACPGSATCRNTVGSYTCQCGYGYYGERRTCQACSLGCPAGQYESSPCGNDGDRSCTGCDECRGSTYEVRPCRGISDRHCMHAAHPLLITGEETTPTFLEELDEKEPQHKKRKRLKVEASDNVFMENLHAMRNLETTYYVTDMTQASDFYWVRESGLQVNIGILDVNLIPEYEDADHQSDNAFIEKIPGNMEDRHSFEKLTRNHCRHPIPNHYSLTLEVSRDRITAATPFICDSKDPSKPACPSSHSDGELYLNRTLNEACDMMAKGTFPESLTPATNSYICTQNSDILYEIFNQTFTPERPIRFPPRKCRSASSRCEQCLDQNRCKMADIFDQQCCQIDCYTLKDCKLASSEECASANIECAMGDAYRFTIQPMYENMKSEFLCHLLHKKPKILYQMFYYIMLPERNFETERIYKTVYAHDLNYQSHGEFSAEYLTVEHNTGLNLREDLIMKGQQLNSMGRWNYTVHSRKTQDQFRKHKKSSLHKMSHNVYVQQVQIATPFGYSTSNWVQGDYCEKDISQFKAVQNIYNDDPQRVNLMMEKVGAPYKYFLKSVDNPPYIRFMAPGNTSVLPWYFKNKNRRLVTDSSLKATLSLTGRGRIWDIRISGKMTGSPAYLGITINNRLDLEELFRYDLLVFDPPVFNISFKVPNWGQDPDKTFDIHLTDSVTNYNIYLTHMLFEEKQVQPNVEMALPRQATKTSWTVVSSIIAIAGLVAALCGLMYVYLDCTKARLRYGRHNIKVYHNSSGKASSSGDHFCVGSRNLNQGQILFIIVYAILRILYSLAFTFTIFFGVLLIFLRPDLEKLNKMDSYQAKQFNASRSMSQRIAQHGQDELLRQAKLVTNMQGACSNYIQELFMTMQERMDNVTASQHKLELYSEESSISFLMNRHVFHQMNKYQQSIVNFTSTYHKRFNRALGPKFISYGKLLQKVYDNEWFQFSQLLFNRSRWEEDRAHVLTLSNLTGEQVDFSIFMEMEQVALAQLWPIKFWQRYAIRQPNLPSLPLPETENEFPSCDTPPGDTINNMSTQTPSDRLDASRFHAPKLPDDDISMRLNQRGSIKEQYRFISAAMEETVMNVPIFSAKDFFANIDTHVLKIIFIVLDALVIMYRISRTYMTTSTLCRGFEESIRYKFYSDASQHSELKEPEMQNLQNQSKHIPIDDRTSERTYLREDKDGLDPHLGDYHTALDSHKSMLPTRANNVHLQSIVGNDIDKSALHHSSHHHANSSHHMWAQRKVPTCRHLVSKFLQSTLLPKILIAFVLLILFYMLGNILTTLLSVEALAGYGGFESFLAGLNVRVNQTNWYLSQQAAHLNNVTMKIYESQMSSELLHLQSMLEYFNAEQSRLVNNYVAEACAVKQSILGSRPCDIKVTPSHLNIPMLPCNFVPIVPQLYSGYRQEKFAVDIGEGLTPFIDAIHNAACTTGYAILIAVASMLLVHLLGLVVFHFLRTRHLFPINQVYITSTPPSATVTLAASHHGHITRDTDSESDENDSGFKTYTSHRTRLAPPCGNNADSLLKYSETKV